MSNELKHADVICHMAKHGFESVEGRPVPAPDYLKWENASCIHNPLTNQHWEWRIKPATITYTVTVPVPMREKPKHGEKYWIFGNDGSCCDTWTDHEVDFERLNAGNCWATEADAQAAFDAIFGPLKASES